MLVLLLLLLPIGRVETPPTAAHPMHTSVAEIGYDDATGAASIQIRVFADDLYAAVKGRPAPSGADHGISRYLEGKFELADQAGHVLPLRWMGAERIGDVLLLRLAAKVPGGLSGVRITSTVLCERFADQVNIVRAFYGGHTTTLLFTRGDPAKPLP
jgi:hypothetical protein